MHDLDLENAVNEAISILTCVQSLLCEARNEVTVEADGLYMLLGCVKDRLNRARHFQKG